MSYQYNDLIPKPDVIIPGKDVLDGENAQKYWKAIFEKKNRDENKDFFGPTNTKHETWNDYVINVVYDRYALNGSSYSIQFWLGGDGEHPDTTFRDEENLIRQKEEKVLSRAQVLLTIPIISQALDHRFRYIESTRIDAVITYLQGHLRWKFVQIGGIERPAKQFPNTKISVLRGIGKPQTAPDDKTDIPPIYAEYEVMHKVTEEKPCGVEGNDAIFGVSQTLYYRKFSD
ncbi:Tyrosinase [Fusarium avenaceum]|nr:Tyrosinase [Fusarium avenaceum]